MHKVPVGSCRRVATQPGVQVEGAWGSSTSTALLACGRSDTDVILGWLQTDFTAAFSRHLSFLPAQVPLHRMAWFSVWGTEVELCNETAENVCVALPSEKQCMPVLRSGMSECSGCLML